MKKAKPNKYAAVKKSGIHNKGMFAKRFIPEGTQVIEYVGDKITKKESDRRADLKMENYKDKSKDGGVYIFTLNSRYDIDGDVSWNPAKYINHSCDPNCETDIIKGKIWIIALRDIEKGEELTYDYGYDLDNWEDHPCYCGSDNCVGFIVAEEHVPKLKRRKRYKELMKKRKK